MGRGEMVVQLIRSNEVSVLCSSPWPAHGWAAGAGVPAGRTRVCGGLSLSAHCEGPGPFQRLLLRRPPPSRLQPCMPSPKGQGAAGPPLCESPQLTQAAWAPPAMSTKERASIYSGKMLGIGRRRLEGGVHAVAVADPLLPRGDLAHRRSTGRSHSSAYVFAVWTTQ